MAKWTGPKAKEYYHQYYLENKAAYVERAYRWAKANPDKIREGKRKYHKNGKWLEYARQYRARIKQAAIEAYGSSCACCGEKEIRFLVFDHVNGDGAEHRKSVRIGLKFHQWLKKHKYPDTVQLLCSNCNHAKSNRPGRNCPVHEHVTLRVVSHG